jgi:hypothetical protein
LSVLLMDGHAAIVKDLVALVGASTLPALELGR